MHLLSRHIPFSRIMDLVEGRLPPGAAEEARAHITGCDRCAGELAFVEQTIAHMRAGDLEEAPAHVIARAVRLFRPAEPAPSPLRRLRAALTFDSTQLQPALSVRAGHRTARQVLLHAEQYALDLRILPASARWIVSGQVLGPDARGRIEVRGATETRAAVLNALGEFKLDPLPAGSYTLDVELASVAIEFDRLELGS